MDPNAVAKPSARAHRAGSGAVRGYLYFAVATVFVVCPSRLRTQQAPAGATFHGVVVRAGDGAPIPGAEVWLFSSGQRTETDSVGVFHWFFSSEQRAQTDSVGGFRLSGLTPGAQLLQIRRLGYDVRRDTVMVSIGDQSVHRFTLVAQAERLDTVRTAAGQHKYLSPMLSGFDERRLSGSGGHFITDSTFRANESSTLGNLLQSRMPGLMFQYFNEKRLAVSTRKACRGPVLLHGCSSKPDCFVALYVDGQLFFNAKLASKTPISAWPDMEQTFSVTTLSGAEYYASNATAPSGMQVDDDGCGSLWLWTRVK
jgi:hypothetical protein